MSLERWSEEGEEGEEVREEGEGEEGRLDAKVLDLSKKMYLTKRTVARPRVMIWRREIEGGSGKGEDGYKRKGWRLERRAGRETVEIICTFVAKKNLFKVQYDNTWWVVIEEIVIKRPRRHLK